MIKVKDETGAVINGVYKDNLGNLIVGDVKEYNKYMYEKQQQEIINNLKEDVNSLKGMLMTIINKLDKSDS